MKGQPGWVFWLLILAIAAFGVGQASVGLGRGLALDESFVANMVHLPWSQMLETVWRHETPLFHSVLKGWVSVFGESEIALRSFSVLCFALAIVTIGYTAKRLGGVGAGLVAALLMSVSYIGLQHAATARMYALLSLQVAVATFLYSQMMALFGASTLSPDRERRAVLLVLLIGVNVTGLLNHSIYLFFMCACNIAALLVSRRSFLLLILCNMLSLALYLGVWGSDLYQLLCLPTIDWMKVPTLSDLGVGVLRLWEDWRTLLLVGYLLVCVLLDLRRAKQFFLSRQGRVAGTMLVVLIVLPFLVSQVKPVFHAFRTPALFLPLACVVTGLLMTRLCRPRNAVVVLLVLSLASVWTVVKGPIVEPGATPARAGVQRVVEKARCGDIVISGGLAINEVAYYVRRFGVEGCLEHVTFPASMQEHPGWLDFADLLSRPEALTQEAEGLVDGLLERGRNGTVWLFYYTEPFHKEIVDPLKSQLDRKLIHVETLALSGSFFDSVLVYSVPSRR